RIKAHALTEIACQLSVDVGRKPAGDAAGCQRIYRTHHVDHYLEETGFVRAERQIAGHWRIHGMEAGRFRCFRERRRRRGGSYQGTRTQRSSACGSGNAEKASTARIEGLVALIVGHLQSTFWSRYIREIIHVRGGPRMREKCGSPHAELSLSDPRSRLGGPERLH